MSLAHSSHNPTDDPVLARFCAQTEDALENAESALLNSNGKLASELEPVRRSLRRLIDDARALGLHRFTRTARAAIRLIDELAEQRLALNLAHEDLLLDAVDDLRSQLTEHEPQDADEESSVTASITRRIAKLRLPGQTPPPGT